MPNDEPNTPAMDALMNAVYFANCRAEYDARIGKNDEWIIGGAAGALKYLKKTIDPERPFSAYIEDVRVAAQALQAEARTQVDGALW